jgi:hypothetical protein
MKIDRAIPNLPTPRNDRDETFEQEQVREFEDEISRETKILLRNSLDN